MSYPAPDSILAAATLHRVITLDQLCHLVYGASFDTVGPLRAAHIHCVMSDAGWRATEVYEGEPTSVTVHYERMAQDTLYRAPCIGLPARARAVFAGVLRRVKGAR